MKTIFSKIIELENHQVLLEKDYEEDEDRFNVQVKTATKGGGLHVKASLGFTTEEKADKAFEEYSEDQAKRFVEGVESMMD